MILALGSPKPNSRSSPGRWRCQVFDDLWRYSLHVPAFLDGTIHQEVWGLEALSHELRLVHGRSCQGVTDFKGRNKNRLLRWLIEDQEYDRRASMDRSLHSANLRHCSQSVSSSGSGSPSRAHSSCFSTRFHLDHIAAASAREHTPARPAMQGDFLVFDGLLPVPAFVSTGVFFTMLPVGSYSLEPGLPTRPLWPSFSLKRY
jgi:hypothetical protein